MKGGLRSKLYIQDVLFLFMSAASDDAPVFVLLKHENYQLVYLPIKDGERRVRLMVPKMKLFFCFFINDSIKIHPDLPKINLTAEETVVSSISPRLSPF